MSGKKVSIIIPVRNEGLFLANTLDSIQRTSKWDNYEVIVVDDASRDGSTNDLVKLFPKMDLNLIQVKQDKAHGPAVCRNRGFRQAKKEATGSVLGTLDGHMVLQNAWLRNMMAIHADNPDAFIIAASCGFRSVADVYVEHAVGLDWPSVVKKVRELEIKYGRPVIVEKSKEEGDDDNPGLLPNLMQQHNICLMYANGPVQKNPVFLFRVKDSVLSDEPPVGVHYGCHPEYDPEDRNFITMKWWRTWNDANPPKQPIVPVHGIMGACYLFPRELFEERIGGWPWLAGWVHEEEYISIAAGLQGIPILLARDIISAHSYDRPVQTKPNLGNIAANQIATIEICFDDMKEKIHKTVFNDLPHPSLLKKLEPELSRRRALVQGGRIMSDEEYLYRMGILHHFDSDFRKVMVGRLGAYGTSSKEITKNGLLNWLKDLHENPNIRFGFGAFEIHEGGANRHQVEFFEAAQWDKQGDCRNKQGITDLATLKEMFGDLLIRVIGRIADQWLRSASPWMDLLPWLNKLGVMEQNIGLIQQFLTQSTVPTLQNLNRAVVNQEIILRTLAEFAKTAHGDEYDKMIEMKQAEIEAEHKAAMKKLEEQKAEAEAEAQKTADGSQEPSEKPATDPVEEPSEPVEESEKEE